MPEVRNLIAAKLWRGSDPFKGFPSRLYNPDPRGWGSDHPFLSEAVHTLRPRVVVEIGVWNGASTRTMAQAMHDSGTDGVVISVDTWLGSSEHWLTNLFELLKCDHGYPALQRTFMTNILNWNLENYVTPLPLDSLNAAVVLDGYQIRPQVIHLDAAHDYESVSADLRIWWPKLEPGGLLIGDDYYDTGEWPGVRKAFDEFFVSRELMPFEVTQGKCRVRKPIEPT